MAFADDLSVVTKDCQGIDVALASVVKWGVPQDATVSGPKTLAAGITYDAEHDTMVDVRAMHADGRTMNHGLTLRVDGVPIRWQELMQLPTWAPLFRCSAAGGRKRRCVRLRVR